MRSSGPWRLENSFAIPVIVDNNGRVVADVRSRNSVKEATDNGKLLAASDRLLLAARRFMLEVEALNVETTSAAELRALFLEVNDR